jgi:hypothetical protein
LVIDMVEWQVPGTPEPGTLATEYFVSRLHQLAIPKPLLGQIR